MWDLTSETTTTSRQLLGLAFVLSAVIGADAGGEKVVHLRASFTGKLPQHDLIHALVGLPGVLHVEGREDKDDGD